MVIDLGCILRFGTAGWEVAGLQSGGFAHRAGCDAEGEDDGYESDGGGHKSLHICGSIRILLFRSLNRGAENGNRFGIKVGCRTAKLPELGRME